MYCKQCDAEVIPVPGDSECPICGRVMADKKEEEPKKEEKAKKGR